MTEVDGPLVPALRFSSLLIRGAEAAQLAGADEQGLEVNCNMAQAFEIPRANRTGYRGLLATGYAAIAKAPRNAFQIAAPGPAQLGDRQLEYGSGFGPPQAHKRWP